MRFYIIVLSCLIGFTLRAQEQVDDYPYTRPLFDFDINKPLFSFNADQLRNSSRYLRYYALTGYREGVGTTLGPFGTSFSAVNNKRSGTRLLYMYNVSIAEIVTHRVGESDRVIYKVKDVSRYRYSPTYGSRTQWLRKNGLCFEVMLPVNSMNIDFVDTLLSKSLGISWSQQKQFINSLVLARLNKSKEIKFQYRGKSEDGVLEKFTGVSFDAVGAALSISGRPFLNETGYDGLIDIKLIVRDSLDLSDINSQLRKYDLVLKEESREINMITVKEVNYNDNQ